MNKQEFLDRLRNALNGRIATSQITETINYYEDYISTEIRKGRTEEDVMEALGDPRLIAKTIVQTQNGNDTFTAESSDYREVYEEGGESVGEGKADGNSIFRGIRLPAWVWTVVAVVVVILLIAAVFSVLSFLAPLLIVMAAVIFMVKLFRDWLN